MKKQRLIFGGIIFLLGVIGVLSLLTTDLPIPEEMMELLIEKVGEENVKYVVLGNPILFILITTIIGMLLHRKVNLRSPILESISGENVPYDLSDLLKSGAIWGSVAGLLILLFGAGLEPFLPEEYKSLNENMDLSLPARFLYGGVAEEIMLRFGLMTLFVWIAYVISDKLTPAVYWAGIVSAALLFGLGHLPALFNMIADPSMLLIIFIIAMNCIAGIIFGWLYMKKGLESAMIAHIFAHIVMVSGAAVFG